MNERAWYYSGSSAISHSRRKQLRRLEGKRNRKPPARPARPNYSAALCSIPDVKNIVLDPRCKEHRGGLTSALAVRDFIGSTSSTNR
jgi:hypothetical protein